MAELWTRTPIMQGDTEQKQLVLITKLCGPINTDVWPGVDKLPLYGKMELPNDGKRCVATRMRSLMENSQSNILPYFQPSTLFISNVLLQISTLRTITRASFSIIYLLWTHLSGPPPIRLLTIGFFGRNRFLLRTCSGYLPRSPRRCSNTL